MDINQFNIKKITLWVGLGGLLLFGTLMSYEFIDLLTNIIYTIILSIIIAFFYQNKESSLMVLYFLLNIEYTPPSKEQQQQQKDHSVATQPPPQVTFKDLQNNNNNNSQPKTDKEIISSLYEQIKELNLTFFNEKLVSDKEKIALQNKLNSYDSIIQESSKSKSSTDQFKQKITDLQREKEAVQVNEQKLLFRLSDYEKRERMLLDNEKTITKKLTEVKELNTSMKKEIDDKQKKISKLEDQISKLTKQLQQQLANNASSNMVVGINQINNGSNSNSKIYSSSSTSTSSSSSIQSSVPINITSLNGASIVNSNNINGNGINNSHSPTPSPGTSPSQLIMPSSTIPSSDEEYSSSSTSSTSSIFGNNNSDSPKPLKSLIKKVKSGSSKIINKAQTQINKHLNTDLFTPPISHTTTVPDTQQLLNLHSNQQQPSTLPPLPPQQQQQINGQSTISSISTVSSTFSTLSSTSSTTSTLNFGQEEDLFKITDQDNSNDLSTSLSDLLQFDVSDIKTTLSSLNHKQSNDQLISTLQQRCIVDYSIKESENKAGLRRAKKKPLSGVSSPTQSMMEDVSFGVYPFDNNYEMSLFGVFDGHAGKEAADSAKTLFPLEISKLLETQYGKNDGTITINDCDLNDLLKKSFHNVDSLMAQEEELQYVGCTATVAFIWTCGGDGDSGNRYLQVANVGDSSAYLCRDGKAIPLTFDHKASDPLEKKRLIDQGIPVSEGSTRINGVAVSRSLGNHFIKDQNIGMISIPHISKPFKLSESDSFLIIASDGLWDVINGEKAIEIGKELIGSRGSQGVASTLLSNALQESECKDNVTVLVVKL